LFAGFVVGAFVVSGTVLLTTGAHETMGYVLVVFGILAMAAHVTVDLWRH
jgi:hypothetical protein